MKFKCGMTQAESLAKAGRLNNWHRWFAWYPVEVAEADCRWLEVVERKVPVYVSEYSGAIRRCYEVAPEYRAVGKREPP